MNLLLILDELLVRLFEKDAGHAAEASGTQAIAEFDTMSILTGPPLVDMEAMAALDFDRWEADATDWTPPTNEEWSQLANPHPISVRFGFGLLR